MNKLSIYFALIFFLILSCKPTDIAVSKERPSQEFSIEQARAIYDRYLVSAKVKKQNEEIMIWEEAAKTRFIDGREVVFVPIITRPDQIPLREYDFAPVKKKDFESLFSPSYLSIYIDRRQDRKSGENVYVQRSGLATERTEE